MGIETPGTDRFIRTVYVDLDDTLVCKGRLNGDLIKFLYQCVNQGKRIVLLSKSLATDKDGADAAAIGQADGDVVVALDDVVGGGDEAVG